MEDIIPCAVKDQEVFQRVWQRVMAGRDQASSPVQPGIPGGWEGDVSCQCLEALMRRQGEGLPSECECPGTEETPEAPVQPEPPVQEPGGEPPVQEVPAPEPPSGEDTPAEGLPQEEGPDRKSTRLNSSH